MGCGGGVLEMEERVVVMVVEFLKWVVVGEQKCFFSFSKKIFYNLIN
jgi:hypothetical protein